MKCLKSQRGLVSVYVARQTPSFQSAWTRIMSLSLATQSLWLHVLSQCKNTGKVFISHYGDFSQMDYMHFELTEVSSLLCLYPDKGTCLLSLWPFPQRCSLSFVGRHDQQAPSLQSLCEGSQHLTYCTQRGLCLCLVLGETEFSRALSSVSLASPDICVSPEANLWIPRPV